MFLKLNFSLDCVIFPFGNALKGHLSLHGNPFAKNHLVPLVKIETRNGVENHNSRLY